MSQFWKFFFVLGNLLVLTTAAGYEGYKLYEIVPENQTQCDLLKKLAQHEELYDFFTLSKLPNLPARVMVAPTEDENLVRILQNHQMVFKLINANVGATIKQEFEINRQLRNTPRSSLIEGRLSTERYYTHAEINSYIEQLAKRYANRVYVKTVGQSYEGRHLKTITITNGDRRPNKNVILMDGAFHAREWISPASVIYAIEQLVEHYNENSELLLDYDWVVLPVVNADGYEFTQLNSSTRLWRKTRKPNVQPNGKICIGTDPNRNFDFHWNEEGASPDPCSIIYAGPKAFSEQEAVVVRDLIHSFQGRGKMYLTVHSAGNMLLYPWGWTSDLPDTWEDLDEVAQAGADAIKEATGTEYTVGSSTNVLYEASGASDDYAFNAGFPISFTMELPPGGRYGFDPPPSSIDRLVKETWIGIRAMAKRVTEKYPLMKS